MSLVATRLAAIKPSPTLAVSAKAAQLKAEGGVCHLCGLPIDPELESPHPMSFTADHIIPMAMGGHLTDRRNLRPAHRICNMKRGTGRGNPRTAKQRQDGKLWNHLRRIGVWTQQPDLAFPK